MTINCLIISLTNDPLQTWHTVAESREEAEKSWRMAMRSFGYPRPNYRVVAVRKSTTPTQEEHAG